MSNLSCGTHVAEPSANKDCRKLLNQFCRFLPKLKLPISADAKLPLTSCNLGYLSHIQFRRSTGVFSVDNAKVIYRYAANLHRTIQCNYFLPNSFWYHFILLTRFSSVSRS